MKTPICNNCSVEITWGENESGNGLCFVCARLRIENMENYIKRTEEDEEYLWGV